NLPQKMGSNLPPQNPPRHVTCNDSQSNNQEYCRAKNGESSPHRDRILNAYWQIATTQKLKFCLYLAKKWAVKALDFSCYSRAYAVLSIERASGLEATEPSGIRCA